MLNARAVHYVLSKSILLSYRIHKRLWETFLFSIVVVDAKVERHSTRLCIGLTAPSRSRYEWSVILYVACTSNAFEI